VFEANAYAGGHTNTIRVDTPDASHQFMTLLVVAGIYAHAVRLAWRGAPYHPHPER
jgi:DUF1365 family protein